MLQQVKRKVVERLPEPALNAVVQTRHGERPWQVRLKRAARIAVGRGGAHAVGRRGLRASVPDSFDAHELRRTQTGLVATALDNAGIAYVAVPGSGGRVERLAVSGEDRARTLDALRSTFTGAQWAVQQLQHGRVPSEQRHQRLDAKSMQEAAAWAGLHVYQVINEPGGRTIGGPELACRLEFWRRIDSDDEPRSDGGTHQRGTRIETARRTPVAYLSPRGWAEATSAATHWPASASRPTVFDIQQPIDFVYTWVDGDDPQWLARKAAASSDAPAGEVNASAAHSSRYVSRDELRYSLRSVAMFANWARRIYIVTDGQVPAWLNTAHPKIKVIDHKEIFTDPSGLPVFNSHAIESQLHHIEGLSEQYLYLNDDVFFGRLVEPELFFHANGISKFFPVDQPLDLDPPSSRDLPVVSAGKHNRELIEADFGVRITQKFKHTPIPQQRAVLAELERRHPEVFARVSHSRFRHPDDLAIPSGLHHYYAYCLGRAVPADLAYVYQDIAREDTQRRLTNLLRTRDADVFCLNDHETVEADLAERQRLLSEFLSQLYPLPSPFELPNAGR